MTTDELFISMLVRVAVRVVAWLIENRPDLVETFLESVGKVIADAIAKRFELCDTTEAANLLRVTAATLADNHVEWGLDKSVAFGATNPRYFLSQILERAAEKAINGRRTDSRTLAKLEVAA